MSSFEVISKAVITSVVTPSDYPKCVCGSIFKLSDYANKKGIHQLTSATCVSCNEQFTIFDINDGYNSIPRGQKARLKGDNNNG